MKKLSKYLLCLFLLLVSSRVYALSVSKNNLNIQTNSNDKVELYAEVDKASSVEFNLTYTTYDIKAEFFVNDEFSQDTPSGIKHIVKFKEEKSGRVLLGTINISVVEDPTDLVGTININNAKSYDSEGNSTNLPSQSITIKVEKKESDEKKQDIDKNLLDKIDSEIVKIDLKKDIFTYDITINEDIEELDLKPIAKDSNTEIDISSQKISEITDNKITIKTKNNDINQDYIINIKINKEKKEVDKPILVDKSDFLPNDSYKNKFKVLVIVFGVLLIMFSLLIIGKKK